MKNDKIIKDLHKYTGGIDPIKDKLFDDLLFGGYCVYKTEIKDGVPHIEYIDPISKEAQDIIDKTTPEPDRGK